MILSSENIFLIIIAIVWLVGAILQDIRRREVDNLWNFSLIAFALSYRAFISVYTNDFWFLLNGIIGFGIFLIIGNIFYYSRIFAGGDAKLLIALGTILPFSYSWIINFKIFGLFILLFLITGSVYALIWSLCLAIINFNRFKKEIYKQYRQYSKFLLIGTVFFVIFLVISIFEYIFILIGLLVLLFPVLFIFAKAIEECCLVKLTYFNKVTEGDWLYEDIVVNGKKIKSNWEGVNKKELELIKKYYRKKILIKQGIPFTPAFLFALIGLIILEYKKFF